MRNPYMKFQNPSSKLFFEQTDARMDKPIFTVWGIMKLLLDLTYSIVEKQRYWTQVITTLASPLPKHA